MRGSSGRGGVRVKRAILLVFSNPSSEAQTDAFHRWYTDVHLPEFLRVPGVVAARRFELSPHQMPPPAGTTAEEALGGRRFLAAYEIEALDLGELCTAILSSAGERTHTGVLQRAPLPLALLFEQIGERQVAESEG